jgi:formamidopyrimidine-DNA glycosylase
MPAKEFTKIITGKTVEGVSSKGKWLFVKLDRGYFLLINLGMGAELLHFKPNQKLPEKAQFNLTFSDKTGFTAHFWWFGYIHLVSEKDLSKHKMTSQLGKSATDTTFTLDYLKELLTHKKTGIKTLLLDQKNVAGIGNVYIQDILFKARLHPNRKTSTLTEKEKADLYHAIREVLNRSIKLRGLAYEMDFYGEKGKFTADEFLVGYRQGKSCPQCKTPVEKIRTGSTASYICPKCQKEK